MISLGPLLFQPFIQLMSQIQCLGGLLGYDLPVILL
jgi:hypothetical protein